MNITETDLLGFVLQNSEWRKVFGSEWKWCHCVVWGLLPWQFRAGLWDVCFNLELMHTISLSLDFCDSRLFCTAVTMRDKLVKASFPASLGKALSVSTHHRSRSQDLLCCKSKLATFQLNVCLWTLTCCDKRKEMEKAPAPICLGSISAQLLNRSTTGCSTCKSYCTVPLFFGGVVILIWFFFQTKQNVLWHWYCNLWSEWGTCGFWYGLWRDKRRHKRISSLRCYGWCYHNYSQQMTEWVHMFINIDIEFFSDSLDSSIKRYFAEWKTQQEFSKSGGGRVIVCPCLKQSNESLSIFKITQFSKSLNFQNQEEGEW